MRRRSDEVRSDFPTALPQRAVRATVQVQGASSDPRGGRTRSRLHARARERTEVAPAEADRLSVSLLPGVPCGPQPIHATPIEGELGSDVATALDVARLRH